MNISSVHHREDNGDIIFKSYIPPSRDAVQLAPHVLYLLMAVFVIMMVLYAIIGHLIKDLFHDFADCLFGKEPEEVRVNWFQYKDRFMVDWCPETSPELEEMARAEQVKVVLENNNNTPPAIWVISDGRDPRPASTGPHVSFRR